MHRWMLHIAATEVSALKPGRTARARAVNSATASPCGSGGTGYSHSAVTRRGSRLVTRSFTPLAFSSTCASSVPAATTCSKLSTRNRMRLPATRSATSPMMPAACASAGDTSCTSRVALRIDLGTVVLSEVGAQDAAMFAQHGWVAVAKLLRQPGRSLDVREQEGDGAGWKVAATYDGSLASRSHRSGRLDLFEAIETFPCIATQ